MAFINNIHSDALAKVGTLSINGKEFTNEKQLPKEFAYMFAHHASLYDGADSSPTNLSVSDFMIPMQKLLYKVTTPKDNVRVPDVHNLARSSIGTMLHTGMEQALEHVDGYIQEVRSEITIQGVTISGKFDICTPDGEVRDLKNISSFAYGLFRKDVETMQAGMSIEDMRNTYPSYWKYVFQLSCYRLLNQDIITQPYGSILFNLTSSSFDDYPTYSEHRLPLFDVEELQEYLTQYILDFQHYLDTDTKPECSIIERIYKPGSYKLTRMGSTGKWATVRGSKFNDEGQFRNFIVSKGKVGDREIITEPSFIACDYCNFSDICEQNNETME